jgi:CheY-like chemotaxis protein
MEQAGAMEKIQSILLVEDQPEMLDNLSLTLEMAGYQTIKAREGYEALTALRSQPVDLILSDIVMPDMDGYQLQKLVRETPEWATIPFLFLTGCRFLSDGEIRYGKALGVKEYLIKPVRSEELLAAIRHTLAESYSSPRPLGSLL